jgi:hypothetical protein
MDHPVANYSIAQGLDDMLLTNDFVPFPGTPFVIKSLGHDQYPSFCQGIR